jgi:tetratricopeptide (TPR) repeat protein
VWLLLAAPVCLLLFVVGRQAWLWKQRQNAEEEIGRYAFSRALPYLDRCLQINPDDLAMRLLAARTARRASRLDLAQEHLAVCQRLAPGSAEVQTEANLLACQQGELSSADEANLELLVKQGHPRAILILEALALGYLYTYRLGPAKQCTDRILAAVPDHVQAYVWRGWIQEGMHRYPDAINDYRQALEHDPDHDAARLRLAEALLVFDHPADALEHFVKLRQRGEDSLALYLGLARCRRRLGEQEEARRLLDDAVARFPPCAPVLRERGSMALNAGHPEEAVSWLRRSLDTDPFDPEACYMLAQALRQTRAKTDADAILARGKHIEEDRQRLHEIMAQLSWKPGEAPLRREAGLLCLRNGQQEEGLRWLKGAVQADPTDQAAHRALAEYYDRVDQPELARKHREESGAAGSFQPAKDQ